MNDKKIRVLVVDDSAVVRQVMTEILESDTSIKVIDTAGDPFIAVEKIKRELPDVITLDVEMPRMDGITFLQKIMTQHPIPVVMCSSLTEEGAETTLRALELGAVDIIIRGSDPYNSKTFFPPNNLWTSLRRRHEIQVWIKIKYTRRRHSLNYYKKNNLKALTLCSAEETIKA